MINLPTLIFCFAALAGQTLAFGSDVIDHLPGLNISLPFKQYSGYLDGDKGRNLFYWFVENEKNASTAPLVLWLNGGPGCSSLAGLLTENGPFRVKADGKSLDLDPFSWNKFANVLYLESPINVGFSFNSTHLEQKDFYNDNATTDASYHALVNFFQKYPQFKNRKLYITGESYGGVYVPLLTRKLLENNGQHGINVQGMAVGNGAFDLELMSATRIEYAYFRDLVSLDDWKLIQSSCCQWNAQQSKYACIYPVYSVNYTVIIHPGNSNQCQTHVDNVLKKILPKYNMYNLNDECNFADPKQAVTHQCTNPKYADYLNQVEVKKALHVHPSVQSTTWASCNYKVVFLYQQQYNSVAAVFHDIVEKHNLTNIVLFNGDADLLCNFILTQQFVENKLKFKLKSPTATWMLNGKVAGMASKFENGLRYFTIRNAGHMVPTQKPVEALAIFKDLLNIEKVA